MNLKTSLEIGKDISKPEQLITEHIDIWTSAILAKSTSGRGSIKKYELYGISKLRELILELAVRGKLVPQDANDEPASIFLEKIAVERDNLIEKGEIKKTKVLPEIIENETFFELPNGWMWSKIGTYAYVFAGTSFKSEDFNKESGTKVIKITNVGVGNFLETQDYLPDKFSEDFESYLVKQEDLVLALTRPYISSGLKVCACPQSYHNSLLNQRVAAIRHIIKSDYLYFYFRNPLVLSHYKTKFSGSGLQPNLKMADILNLPIAVPPLAEQQRIVAKVDELMLLCDQLEQQTEASIEAHATLVEVLLATFTDSGNADELAQNWARISEHFDSLFTTEQSIEALKQTVLQLAVMGKLVPQDPNDEPASVLVRDIMNTKSKDIEEGKVKKSKKLEEVNEESLFDLPVGWVWEQMGNLGDTNTGLTYSPHDVDTIGTPVLRSSNIQKGKIDLSDLVRVNKQVKESSLVHESDLLICARNGSKALVGKTAQIINLSEPMAFGAFMTIFRSNINNYIEVFLNSPIFRARLEGVATTTINQITQSNLRNTMCPLPPLAEQLRIVAKVDELMAICDQLKERLKQSKETQVQLTDALVDRALG